MDLDLALPELNERERLLDGLARVIARAGYERLVRSPVLLPSAEYFPDRVERGEQGARTLLRRLGAYAGLGSLRVQVRVFEEQAEHETFDHHGVGHGGTGALAWFEGIEGGVCRYGVERRELRDPEELIGTLGHEVAHAFREHHGLVVTSRDVEEKLTDLTAVYLGFGVFLLNSSWTFKTGGVSEKGDRLLYETRVRGYLSPPQIATLLGAQATARDASDAERSAIVRALSPNHAKLFEDACAAFAGEALMLRGRLGIPEAEAWPEPAALPPEVLREEDEESEAADEGDEGDEETREEREAARDADHAASHPVAPATRAFRMQRDRGLLYAVIGFLLPFLPAVAGLLEGGVLAGAMAICGALGFAAGKASRDDRCSACNQPLPRRVDQCDACSAIIAGSVRTDAERLDAEEALEAEAESEDYDYFADPEVPGEYKVESRLLTAIFVDWVLRRGLVLPEFSEQHPELLERARDGELDTAALFELWENESSFLDETGAAFSSAYFDETGAWNPDDYALLTTANRIRDTQAGYRRAQELLDRRFEAWQRERVSAENE